MMVTDLKARSINVVELSYMGQDHAILSPQSLALKLSNRVIPLDVGVFAYSIRGRLDPRKGTYWVDERSLVASRKKLIISLLDSYYTSGATEGSINTDIKNFEYALNWCDANGFVDVFCNSDSARLGYAKFTGHLFQEILKPDGASPLSCQARQRVLKKAVQLQFPESCENIVAGVQPIKHIREGLEPPEEHLVSEYVEISLSIALCFSRFVMDGAPFPLRFNARDYHTYIYPLNGSIVTPYSKASTAFNAYDFAEGRIKEVSELSTLNRKQARISVINAHENLLVANSDPYHFSRQRLASLAMQAYACLINLVVGANSGELVQFLYDDALELVSSPLKKELSAIKLRAKGLEVNYTVGRGAGMKILKEYLAFREWTLKGRKCDYLFFRPVQVDSDGRAWRYERLNLDFSATYFKKLRGTFLPATAKNIPPLRVRKYKSLVLHLLKHSPLLVSAVMNHHPRTNMESYSGIGVSEQKVEFANYWGAVKKAAMRARDADQQGSVSIATGHCGGMDNPSKDIPVVAIEPDCKSPYGCLFCEHYQVHSDEEDIHKLTSFQYVIDAIRNNAPVFSFSEETFKDLAVRIEVVLDAISQRSDSACKLVETIRSKVFDLGILTPFWEQRLQRYEKMGIYI
ncbi:hypothetical protein [Pseudomonas sp. EA_35y_Pfl2_R5]|uniref:hypothetical protein n=1 Tax=Pseudomonas sp. EA_35y_Pfl2_R5 TaxID=3088690 RepID=UPI0030DA65E7